MNLGMTHGIKHDGSYSLLANAMPKYFMFSYGKPIEMQSYDHLMEFTRMNTNLIPGDGALVLDNDPKTPGLQNIQYVWDKYKWVEIGNPHTREFLNIYHIRPQKNQDSPWKASLYMRTHISNIRSNIRLLSILDRNYIIQNNEFVTFCGLNGEYTMDNSFTGNVISLLLDINLKLALNIFFNDLCEEYQVPTITFKEFITTTIISLDKLIKDTSYYFYQIYQNYTTIDLSQYFNFVSCCFASFKNVYKSKYNNNINIPTIDPLDSLEIIDKPLLNRLRISSHISADFKQIVQFVDDILYRHLKNNSPDIYRYYVELTKLVEYFMLNNSAIKDHKGTRNKFLTDLNEGIAGIINLAIYMAVLSSNSINNRTTLYFHFVAPEKYKNI